MTEYLLKLVDAEFHKPLAHARLLFACQDIFLKMKTIGLPQYHIVSRAAPPLPRFLDGFKML